MNSGPTSERVYDTLKRRILAREFRPGAHLDPASLGEALGSSVTPVRDALHTLKGELLVESRTSEGFYLPHVDAPTLQDLYAWNKTMLDIALKERRSNFQTQRLSAASLLPPAASADYVAALFGTIGERSRNLEMRRAIAALNDRLHTARLVEHAVIPGADDELSAIHNALVESDDAAARRAIASYHRRRGRAVADIVRALYRNGDH